MSPCRQPPERYGGPTCILFTRHCWALVQRTWPTSALREEAGRGALQLASKQEASLGHDPVMRSRPYLSPERQSGQNRLCCWSRGGNSRWGEAHWGERCCFLSPSLLCASSHNQWLH